LGREAAYIGGKAADAALGTGADIQKAVLGTRHEMGVIGGYPGRITTGRAAD
jgi:hypothetical protein